MTSNDSFFSRTKEACHLFLNESVYKPNNTFHCILTRRKRKEYKTLTVMYGNDKEMPKQCSSAVLLMHEAQGLLWSISLHTLLKMLS
ncbi:hypothetical protein AMEX_G21494 [Astyanax mexicanus]|uniref:Uncharacterized protein n=1 Tax=Astyanax mexicanus TaxID=7994 RepID=A0A8T2KZP6_ASTMX|nr:hypothetical protein AMEX_G21494 [Astyanax mexicanus]